MVWDVSVAEGVNIVLGSLLCLLTGTMLGMLLRSSAGGAGDVLRLRAPAAHRVRRSWPPARTGSGTCSRGWTSTTPRASLFDGTLTGEQWANVAVTAGDLARPARRSSASGWS